MESEGECTDGEMYAEYASTAARERAHSERFAEGLSVQRFIVLFLPVTTTMFIEPYQLQLNSIRSNITYSKTTFSKSLQLHS